jgi:hypothetical protein
MPLAIDAALLANQVHLLVQKTIGLRCAAPSAGSMCRPSLSADRPGSCFVGSYL